MKGEEEVITDSGSGTGHARETVRIKEDDVYLDHLQQLAHLILALCQEERILKLPIDPGQEYTHTTLILLSFRSIRTTIAACLWIGNGRQSKNRIEGSDAHQHWEHGEYMIKCNWTTMLFPDTNNKHNNSIKYKALNHKTIVSLKYYYKLL